MKIRAREVLTGVVAVWLAGCGVKKLLDLEAPGGRVALMTGVLISKEGGGYKVQYSLQDEDLAFTSAKGKLTISFVDYDAERTVYFEKVYEVEKSDFKKYATILGVESWGHVIIIRKSEVGQYGSDIHAKMKMEFETSGGAVFESEDSFFL